MKTKLSVFAGLVLFSIAAVMVWVAFLGMAETAEARTIAPDDKVVEPARTLLATTTYTLYDGALGGTPNSQGSLLYLNLPPGSATNSASSGVTTLDTTIVNDGAYAGYFNDHDTNADIPVLNRTTGYTLTFTAQVESESHANNNRAGFSVIILGDDSKGIEMAFWENEIWVQDDDANDPGDLFTHAEGAAYSTTTSLQTYHLAVFSDTYTLTVGSSTILTGRLRDYTNFSGSIDPYETPNFIFLGDDTTSAQARIKLSFVAVETAESPPPPPDYLTYLPFVRTP
ncbi:MAG: hypothetical protein WAM60_16240 [Candidatus Promineifilaceae bacterium]